MATRVARVGKKSCLWVGRYQLESLSGEKIPISDKVTASKVLTLEPKKIGSLQLRHLLMDFDENFFKHLFEGLPDAECRLLDFNISKTDRNH